MFIASNDYTKFERHMFFECPVCGIAFVWAKDRAFETGRGAFDGWAITFDNEGGLPGCEDCQSFSLGVIEGFFARDGSRGDSIKKEYDIIKKEMDREELIGGYTEKSLLMMDGECND